MGDPGNQNTPLGYYAYIVVSLLIYVTEFVFNITASYVLLSRHDYLWFSLTLGLLIIPVVVTHLISVQWISRNSSKGIRYTSLLFHVLQLGIVWRHCHLACTKQPKSKKSDLSELCLLRAIHAFSSSAPLLLLWSYYVIHLHLDYHWTSLAIMITCYVSTCWSIATFRHQFGSSDTIDVLLWPDTVMKLLWRFGEIASRALSVTLFTAVYGYWILLVLGLHWFVMFVWSVLQRSLVRGSLTRCQATLHSFITSYMYLFCYLNVNSGNPRYRIIFFYIIMTVENAGLIALGILFGSKEVFQIGLSISGIISLLIGLSAAYIYYRFFHVESEKCDQNKDITDGKNGCINCRLSVCVKHNFMLQRPFNRAWIERRRSDSMQCLIPGSRMGSYESIDFIYSDKRQLKVLSEDTELEMSYDDAYTTYIPLTTSSYTNYSASSYFDKFSDLYSEAQFSTRTLATSSHLSKISANSAKSNTSKVSYASKASSNNYSVCRPHSQLSNMSKSSTNRHFTTSSVATHLSNRTEKASNKSHRPAQETASSPLPSKDYYKTFFTDELDSIYQGSVNSGVSSQKSKNSLVSSQKSRLKQSHSPVQSDTQSDNNAPELEVYNRFGSGLQLTPASSIVNLLCGTTDYTSANSTIGTNSHYQKRPVNHRERRTGRKRHYSNYNIGWQSDLSSLSEYENGARYHDASHHKRHSRPRPNYPHQNHRKLREYVRSKQRKGHLIGLQSHVTRHTKPMKTKIKRVSNLPSSEINSKHIVDVTKHENKLSVRATGYQGNQHHIKSGYNKYVRLPIKTNGSLNRSVVDRLSPRAVVPNGILKSATNELRNNHKTKSLLSVSSGEFVDKLSPRARTNVAVHKTLDKNGLTRQLHPQKSDKLTPQNGLKKTGLVTSDGEELYILKPLKLKSSHNYKHIVLNSKPVQMNGKRAPVTEKYIVLKTENEKNFQKEGVANQGYISDIVQESKHRHGNTHLTSQPDLICPHSDIDSIHGLSDYSLLDSTQDGSSMDPHWYECYSDTESTEV